RFRKSYFPFTEPSVEVDVDCILCGGEGCRVCKYSGWLEILGAGMVHPNVLKHVGVDPEKYSGFAWGFGLDRLVMIKNGIEDIRWLHSGNLNFIKQF
ncbi:phenylalanine--tRNA ligase subunit alpha, partial [Candidatus Dojkabacteria bacterium]|nr:phenylalanine--tRNA ligase subunit alpha [Candidatus Dojkabacteria bacterium]